MECEICKATLSSNRELLRHLAHKHNIRPPEYFCDHPTAHKFCSKCKQALPISNYLRDKGNTYGFRAQCLACMKPGGLNQPCPICNRLLRWSAIITHMKTEHGIAPIEGFTQYLKQKLCPNCKNVKALDAFLRQADPDSPLSSWCADCNLQRNVDRAKSDHAFNAIDHLVIRLTISDCCFVCGTSHEESVNGGMGALQIDHLHPFIKGGALTIDNAVLLCKRCNLGKGSGSLGEFFRRTGATDEDVLKFDKELRTKHAWAKRELARVVLRYSRTSSSD